MGRDVGDIGKVGEGQGAPLYRSVEGIPLRRFIVYQEDVEKDKIKKRGCDNTKRAQINKLVAVRTSINLYQVDDAVFVARAIARRAKAKGLSGRLALAQAAMGPQGRVQIHSHQEESQAVHVCCRYRTVVGGAESVRGSSGALWAGGTSDQL